MSQQGSPYCQTHHCPLKKVSLRYDLCAMWLLHFKCTFLCDFRHCSPVPRHPDEVQGVSVTLERSHLAPHPLWSVCLHQPALPGSPSTWSHVTRDRWCVTLSESQHSEPSSEQCPRGSRTACAAHSPIRALWVVPTLSRSVQGAVNSRTHGFV